MEQKISLINQAVHFSCILAFFCIGLLTTIPAEAASVTLAWDSVQPAPEGYRVFVRKANQAYDYSRPTWQGTTLSATVNNLQDYTEYYFAVRAYQGYQESTNSNEIRYITPLNGSNGSDTTPPYWDGASLGIGSASAAFTGGRVTVEFDTARDGVDGRNLRFNVYYAPSASWDNHDWTGNSVIADAAVRSGGTFAHAFTIDGLTNGVRYTVGIRVEDQSGNEDTNISTLRVTPSASSSATIIDNRSSQTSRTGTWSTSSGSGHYDRDSLWSRDGSTFTWHFTPSQSGVYDVAMWWTEWSSRSTRIPVKITHAHGTATVHVNQQTNGGRWNSQGQFHFQAGTTYRVAITSQPGPSSTCADAVRFQLVQEVIVDNRASQTSRTGTWSTSSSSGHYDRDSLWSRDGSTFTWHFTPSQSGVYDVAMWWTEWSSRSTRIPVNITHVNGLATVYVNQQANGGRWNSQGRFHFKAGTTYYVKITAQPGPSSTCADAVRFRYISAN